MIHWELNIKWKTIIIKWTLTFQYKDKRALISNIDEKPNGSVSTLPTSSL